MNTNCYGLDLPILKKNASSTNLFFFKISTYWLGAVAYAGNLLPSHAAATVSHSQPHAATCSHLQPLPGTHNHTQPLAATRSPSSGRKWPQVTAAVKWPQVAASGCFRQVAASGRKWPLFPISISTPNATPLGIRINHYIWSCLKKLFIRNIGLPETNISRTWKRMVGIRSFPFGVKGLFSGVIC